MPACRPPVATTTTPAAHARKGASPSCSTTTRLRPSASRARPADLRRRQRRPGRAQPRRAAPGRGRGQAAPALAPPRRPGEVHGAPAPRPLRPHLLARQPPRAGYVGHPDRGMSLHAVEPARFREVMGHFATGVAVVTATTPGGPVGMTANAVCSLSLDPLLVLVCFANGARTLRSCARPGASASTCSRRGQEELARRFASKLPEAEKFAGGLALGPRGDPGAGRTLAWVGAGAAPGPGGDHTIGSARPGRRDRWSRRAADVVPRPLRRRA